MQAQPDQPLPSGFLTSPQLRFYAVGDIHGRLDLLEEVNAKIETDLKRSPCWRSVRVFLGDYVDRGLHSREVLDYLVALEGTCDTVFILGNHETFLTDFIQVPTVLPTWLSVGGLETLISYGIRPPRNPSPADQSRLAAEFAEALPVSHLNFIRSLRPCFAFDDVFFVHAGVRPGVPLSEQSLTDLCWIRDDFLRHDGLFERLVIHGHTPVRAPDIRPNRINIDTGAYATGQLTCMWIEGGRMGFL
ncbi:MULTISPECIES: metallophosphoesterase family protein [unclassified Bradyrhizobium]|uniref:metallophosphoesterase family protein n=1 Tax=unclassified Bradyrhizobium TaxID=2631580 RepID=UPI001BAA2E8E|nr:MULTISPECIES: metallophosphoesterase family protein [unclassified Bradyrhizobium]MBR1207455.1 serine/threonine protein phosphatase [Bradyrhizobium sp. AUGA SZCCT0124]MBR1315871.1 serine/threonine protein phosphatase [Bradyrhizobium sp. AUGA SZCCT0051]MBR1343977.1 serine/threonine protein phosphatase [Bradyrhizobium sp. AUGA SZCCT0105]MBR1358036.1 serine/threonine protein phosphatase [Bradyrhizobium sp. AUGA SZCCT0045]